MADSYGQVAQRCPSSSTAAYVAIADGSEWSSSRESVSLQRANITGQLELLLVSALPKDAYTDDLKMASVTSLVLCLIGVLVALLLVGIPWYMTYYKWRFTIADAIQKLETIFLSIVVLVSVAGIVWLICLSRSHGQAVSDFSTQVVASISVALGSRLDSSETMTEQATQTWLHTGAATGGLSILDSWATELMQDFYDNSRLSTLRFGTTAGLEQSANGTASGVRVLSRTSTSECLKTYLTDGTTSDSSTYPNQCDHDPRYTPWYEHAYSMTNQSGFTNTYNNAWIAAVGKASASSSFKGVWASEFKIHVTSVGSVLESLKEGFTGSLAVIEHSGIVLSTSSGVSIEPAYSCSDGYISSAAGDILAGKNTDWTDASGTFYSSNIVGVGQTSWARHPQASGKFVAVMSFDREQLYRIYDRTKSNILAIVLVFIVVIGVAITQASRILLINPERQRVHKEKVYGRFLETKTSAFVDELRARLCTCIRALRVHLGAHPILHSQLDHLEGIATSHNDREISAEEALHRVGLTFLHDLALGRDTELHLALLLCDHQWRVILIFLFRCFSTEFWLLGANGLLVALVWLGWRDEIIPVVQSIMLLLCLIDTVLHTLFKVLRSRGFEVNSGGDDGPIVIPWRVQNRMIASVIYPILFLVGCASTIARMDDSDIHNTANYMFVIMLILRNDQMWPAYTKFGEAVLNASSIAYLFMCMVLVLSGMVMVLLRGQYTTGDFYLDNQWEDYWHSADNTLIFLMGGNYVDAAQPALLINGAYALLFIVLALVGLFFVTSLLIQIFADAYGSEAGSFTSERRQQWAALTLAYQLWLTEAGREMSSERFEQLMMASTNIGESFSRRFNASGWLTSLRTLTISVFNSLHDYDGNVQQDYPQEAAALAALCCELHFERHYQIAVEEEWLPASAPLSCHEAERERMLPRVLEKLDLCDRGAQVLFVQNAISQTGVAVTEAEAESLLESTFIPLSFDFQTQAAEVRQTACFMLQLRYLPTASSMTQCDWNLLKIDSAGGMLDWQQAAMASWVLRTAPAAYGLHTASSDPLTNRVVQLVSMVQVHRWRLQLLFDSLDTDGSGELSLVEFDRLWSLSTFCSGIAPSQLVQGEAELMLLDQHISEHEGTLMGVMLRDDRAVATTELDKLSLARDDVQLEVDELLAALSVGERERLLVVQLVAWANVWVAAWYGCSSLNDATATALEWLLFLFPIGFLLELIQEIWVSGWRVIILSHERPAKQMARWCSLGLIGLGLLGSICRIDPDGIGVSQNTARGLASFTGLLVVTKARQFDKTLLTFGRAVSKAVPTVIAITIFVMLYALGSTDLFGYKVKDGDGNGYFNTPGASLRTLFELFVAGWGYDIMFACSAATTEAAQLWFIAYIFLLTLFGAELFVGLIVSLFEEINSLDSSRLYNILQSTFNLREQEREDVVTALLELNRQMRPHNRLMADLECNVVSEDCTSGSEDGGSLTRECMSLRDTVAALMREVTQLSMLNGAVFTELQHCLPGLLWKLQDGLKLTAAHTNSQEGVRSAQCSFVSWWLSGLVAAGCGECIEQLLTEKETTEEARAEVQEQVRL